MEKAVICTMSDKDQNRLTYLGHALTRVKSFILQRQHMSKDVSLVAL